MILVALATACQEQKAAILNVESFNLLIDEELSLQLVDVRTPEEFKSGHIENALLIDYFSEDFESRLENLNKSEPIAVYCAVGQRSLKVYELLQEKGFKEVYHMEGGVNQWIADGNPVMK